MNRQKIFDLIQAKFDNIDILDFVNDLLNAKTDDYIGIARVDFENGNYLLIDIASGSSNYYDNIVLYDKNDSELYVFDCEYKIDSFDFEYENNMYSLEIETF